MLLTKLRGDVALSPRGPVSRCPKRKGRCTQLRAQTGDYSPLPWGWSPPCRFPSHAVWTRTPCGQSDLNVGGPQGPAEGLLGFKSPAG